MCSGDSSGTYGNSAAFCSIVGLEVIDDKRQRALDTYAVNGYIQFLCVCVFRRDYDRPKTGINSVEVGFDTPREVTDRTVEGEFGERRGR